MLAAFDTLFDAAVERLNAEATAEERDDARARFVERFGGVLDLTSEIQVDELPGAVLDEMRAAIRGLSTAELAGTMASLPLAQQTQAMLRTLAVRQAQQKVLEHLASQADTTYGGN